MRKRINKFIILLLSFCILFSSFGVDVFLIAPPKGLDYLNTYENTGDQRKDILGVALTQSGYIEERGKDTKFGNWYGYPGDDWCAMFITWCARQADIPETILKRAHNASPLKFGIEYKKGSEYTPQPGDLFFTKGFTHVGIVYYVDGDVFYTIEGNTENFDTGKYMVMSKERIINEFYFGVPKYEGGDKEHNYVKKQEDAHPHNTYYECTVCGDINYTGYTECVLSCESCITCNCSTSYAGYYKFRDKDYGWQRIRAAHSKTGTSLGCVSDGEIVYVYAANPSSNLAYINYDGTKGHVPWNQLTKYNPPPKAVTGLSVEKDDYIAGDNVKISWNIPEYTEQIKLTLYRNNEIAKNKVSVGLNSSYTINNVDEGSYKAEIIACNLAGVSKKETIEFSVRNIYYLYYDIGEGSGAPETASQAIGENVTVSEKTPERSGYTFLGWTDEKDSKTAKYFSGNEIKAYKDITLYAVWMQNGAILNEIEVYTEPSQKYYLLGEELDLSGLKVKMNYSDGTSKITDEGFEVTGFDSSEIGVKTLTIVCGEVSCTFMLEVMEYIPGDIDLNKLVNRDDVMALLWHITFPTEFPVTVPANFNGDEIVNRDDVMALLWHITFPEEFPLSIN